MSRRRAPDDAAALLRRFASLLSEAGQRTPIEQYTLGEPRNGLSDRAALFLAADDLLKRARECDLHARGQSAEAA